MHFKRVFAGLALALMMLGGFGAPALAGAAALTDQAASRLRDDPVFVHPDANPTISVGAADQLRAMIRDGNSAIFIAVLPEAARQEVDNFDNLPRAIGMAMGRDGTIGVIAGKGFRGGSSVLPTGKGGELATLAFQANRTSDGVNLEGMLTDFVGRVQQYEGGSSGPTATPFDRPAGSQPSGSSEGTSIPVLPVLGIVLAVIVVVIGGFVIAGFVSRKREFSDYKQELLDRKSGLDGDVVNLADQVKINPGAERCFAAASDAYNSASADLGQAKNMEDLQKVEALLAKAEAQMADAKAYLDGRDPEQERAQAELKREKAARRAAQAAERRRAREDAEQARADARAERAAARRRRDDRGRDTTIIVDRGNDDFATGVLLGSVLSGGHDHHDDDDDRRSSGGSDFSFGSSSSSHDSGGGGWSSSSDSGGGDWGGGGDSGGGGGDWGG
jgi:uncharacterized membrane protein YgcG